MRIHSPPRTFSIISLGLIVALLAIAGFTRVQATDNGGTTTKVTASVTKVGATLTTTAQEIVAATVAESNSLQPAAGFIMKPATATLALTLWYMDKPDRVDGVNDDQKLAFTLIMRGRYKAPTPTRFLC